MEKGKIIRVSNPVIVNLLLYYKRIYTVIYMIFFKVKFSDEEKVEQPSIYSGLALLIDILYEFASLSRKTIEFHEVSENH